MLTRAEPFLTYKVSFDLRDNMGTSTWAMNKHNFVSRCVPAKASAVIHMLEQRSGEDNFKRLLSRLVVASCQPATSKGILFQLRLQCFDSTLLRSDHPCSKKEMWDTIKISRLNSSVPTFGDAGS